MTEISLKILDMECAACVARLDRVISRLHGVKSAQVNFTASSASITYDETPMMFGDKEVKCSDQNNADLYKKPMIGKALCLPQTIGSTTGGMALYTVLSSGKQPACMLFSMTIDSLAASGAILGSIWTDARMPVIDELGDEFLNYVRNGMTVTVRDGGIVEVE